MRKIMILLAMGLSFSGCLSQKSAVSTEVQLQGTLQKSGMTTYQYGTHVLKSGDKTYALTSKLVKLDDYEGKDVNIKGTNVPGYPVENGPQLVEVISVIVK